MNEGNPRVVTEERDPNQKMTRNTSEEKTQSKERDDMWESSRSRTKYQLRRGNWCTFKIWERVMDKRMRKYTHI